MTKFSRFTLMTGFVLSLLLLNEKSSLAFQNDSRGFPITSAPGPSFGAPPVNSSSFGMPPVRSSAFGAPQVTLPPPLVNQSHPGAATVQHHHKHRDHGTPFFFYFNSSGYPYYINTPIDGNFYYSISPDNNTAYDAPSQPPSTASLPNGIWVATSGGRVPINAIAYDNANNTDTYYCRAYYRSTLYYGILTRDDGCYIQNQSVTIRFNQYEVLVSY